MVDGGPVDCGAVDVMEVVWPSGAALRGEASNRPQVHWLKTVVLNVVGKGAARSRQVWVGKMSDGRKSSAVDVSKAGKMTSKPGSLLRSGVSLAFAALGLSGSGRHRNGVTRPARRTATPAASSRSTRPASSSALDHPPDPARSHRRSSEPPRA